MEVVTEKNKNTELALKLLKVCMNSSFMEKTEYLVFLGFSLARYLQEPIESYMGPLFISATKVLRISDLVKGSVSYHGYFNLYQDIYNILRKETDIDFGELYEEIIRITVREFHHEYIDSGYWNELPEELIPFISQLCDSQKGKSILVPFAGSGLFLLQDDSSFIKAYEPNKQLWFVGILRLIFKNMDTSLFFNIDPFIYNYDSNVKHDLVLLNAPIGAVPDDIRIEPASRKVYGYHHADKTTLAVEYALYNIKPEGSVIAVVPESFLSRSNEFSKRLFLNGYIDTIIQLPSIYERVIVIFKNRKDDDNGIVMVNFSEIEDAGSLVHEYERVKRGGTRYAAYKEKNDILGNNGILYPSWYVDTEDTVSGEVYFAGERIPDGYIKYKLGEFLTPIEKVTFTGMADVVDARDMCRMDSLDYELNTRKLNPCFCEGEYFLLNENLIVFPDFEHWNEQVMFWRHQEGKDPVSANDSVFPFRFNPSIIDPVYFCWECQSEFVQEQLVGIKLAFNDEKFPMQKLLDVMIVIPQSLEEQKAIYAAEKDIYRYEKLKELGFEEILLEKEAEINRNIGVKRHEITHGTLPNLMSRIEILKIKVDSLKANNISDINLKDDIERIKTLAKQLGEKVRMFDSSDFIKEGTVIDLSKSVQKYTTTNNYEVIHDIGFWGEAKVFIGDENFDLLMRNIIRNAEKHGFENRKDKHIIRIELNYDICNDSFVLGVANNGNPMKEVVDTDSYSSYGFKAGKTSNEGKGGYIIDAIVKRFKGSLEVKKSSGSFPVKIIVKLPKYDEYERNKVPSTMDRRSV